MSSDTLNVDDMRRYIAEAGSARPNTQQDRIVDVFWQLRRDLPAKGWHRIEGLREFCAELSDYNPFIPPVVSQIEHLSYQRARRSGSFVGEWTAAGLSSDMRSVSETELRGVLATDPTAAAELRRMSGSDANRLYTKLAEWHVALDTAERAGAKVIVDLGTMDEGFARTARARLGEGVRIDMVDTEHKRGRTVVEKSLHTVRADARDLKVYRDNSVDMVCMLNSLEHFTGQRDGKAIREVERILKPGGSAVIVPFRGAAEYILSIQPVSCFLAPLNDTIGEDVENEVRRGKCLVRYNHKIISPFARTYDFAAAKRRLLDKVPGMSAQLSELRFNANAADAGGELPAMPSSFESRTDMLALTLTKPK